MNTDLLYGILSGGGFSAVVIALINMFSGKSLNEADVADRFSGTMDSVLASAEAQVKRMDKDLHRMNDTIVSQNAQLRENQELLDEQARTIRELRDVTREMLTEMESNRIKTLHYRERLQAI